MVEAPARQANRPRARAINYPDEPESLAPWEVPNSVGSARRAPIAARGEGGRKQLAAQGRSQRPRARAIASPDGTQVAIIPAEDFWEGPDALPPAAGGAVGTPDEVEAVLALRPRSYRTAYDESIAAAARAHAVDPLLLHAVIKQESGYGHRARSRVGALGLMQVMPGTGRMLGVANAAALYDPQTNLNAGARLLNQLWSRFEGNLDLVLAAYNAGEGAVRRHGNAVPPYRETRDYVAKVKANYRQLAAESGLAVEF